MKAYALIDNVKDNDNEIANVGKVAVMLLILQTCSVCRGIELFWLQRGFKLIMI